MLRRWSLLRLSLPLLQLVCTRQVQMGGAGLLWGAGLLDSGAGLVSLAQLVVNHME